MRSIKHALPNQVQQTTISASTRYFWPDLPRTPQHFLTPTMEYEILFYSWDISNWAYYFEGRSQEIYYDADKGIALFCPYFFDLQVKLRMLFIALFNIGFRHNLPLIASQSGFITSVRSWPDLAIRPLRKRLRRWAIELPELAIVELHNRTNRTIQPSEIDFQIGFLRTSIAQPEIFGSGS